MNSWALTFLWYVETNNSIPDDIVRAIDDLNLERPMGRYNRRRTLLWWVTGVRNAIFLLKHWTSKYAIISVLLRITVNIRNLCERFVYFGNIIQEISSPISVIYLFLKGKYFLFLLFLEFCRYFHVSDIIYFLNVYFYILQNYTLLLFCLVHEFFLIFLFQWSKYYRGIISLCENIVLNFCRIFQFVFQYLTK